MNLEMIKELEKTIDTDYGNIAGIIVRKNDRKVYENYFNGCAAGDAIHVFSVTKSIFGILIGIAIDRGYIKNVEQKVLEFFPEHVVAADEKTIQGITIKNLLTMTAPYKYAQEPYEDFFVSENWVEAALGFLGGNGPAGAFVYSAIVGTHILGGILARATGRPVLDFAVENLFSPLKIAVAQNWIFGTREEQMAFYAKGKHTGGWVADPQGINTASWGLTLTPLDMAKIGQLCLNGGAWDNRQIVSAGWIEESTRRHSQWGEMQYGYLWWLIDEKEHSYAAMGDGGNVIYVNTQKQLVVAIASFFMPEAKDRIDFIKEHIEPLFTVSEQSKSECPEREWN